MGKLLTILGITEQSNLPEEILTAESLITGMQFIYQNSPEGEKKEALAKAIAETIRLTIQQIKGLPLTPPKPTFVIEVGDRLISKSWGNNYYTVTSVSDAKQISFTSNDGANGLWDKETINLALQDGTITLIKAKDVKLDKPRVLTGEEMESIYGANWEEEISLEPDADYLEWVSPDMDYLFGQPLTDKQIENLQKGNWAVGLPGPVGYAVSIFMTTLNPKFKSNNIILEVGDRLISKDWGDDYLEIIRNDDWSTFLNTKNQDGTNQEWAKELILRNLQNGSLTLVKAKDVKTTTNEKSFFIFTEEEFRLVYGATWRTTKSGDGGQMMIGDAEAKGFDGTSWTTLNDMDYLFGQLLTPQQVAELQNKGDIYVDYAWYIGIMMTTLNPYYFKVGDVFDSTNKKLVYEITDIDTTSKYPNVIVTYNATHSSTTESHWDNSLETVEKIRSGHWVKRGSTPQQTTPTTKPTIQEIQSILATIPEFTSVNLSTDDNYDNNQVLMVNTIFPNWSDADEPTDSKVIQYYIGYKNGELEVVDLWFAFNEKECKNLQEAIEFMVNTRSDTSQRIVQVGDIFKHATEPAQETWEVYKIENDRVSIKWGASSNRKVEYQLQDVTDYINRGIWIKINNQQTTPTPSSAKPLFQIGDYVITDYGMVGEITDCNGTAPNFIYDAVKSNGLDAFVSVPENSLKKINLDTELKILGVQVGNVFKISENYYLRIWEITKDKVITIDSSGILEQVDKDELIVLITTMSYVYFKDGEKPLYKIGDVVTWGSDLRDMTIIQVELDNNGDWFYFGNMEDGTEDGTTESNVWLSTKKTVPQPTKTTTKKTIRQSPEISANDVKAGTKKKGLDGNMWVAKKTMAGYNQWKKVL